VAQGTLAEADLLEVVAGAAEDTILDLLTWHQGTFRFEENAELPQRPNLVGRVPVDRAGVILRAAQRVDERTAIAEAVGEHACLFLAIRGVAPALDDPDDPTPRVYGALDGRATIDEVALRLGISRFTALKAASALVEMRAARRATSEELSLAVQSRMSTKQYRVARLIVLQWADTDANDGQPLRTLATLGERRERPVEVSSALTLLGYRLLKQDAGAAARAFQDAVERRPGDAAALEGLRTAAEASGDAGLWSNTTLRMAQSALDGDDPARTIALSAEVLARTPEDVGAMLLRAKAFTARKDREGVVETAEVLLKHLGKRATRRVEREAAQFCSDAVAVLAPERTILVKSLRAVSRPPTSRRRRVALVAALVVVASGAGVMFWPEQPGRLLEKARDAAEDGEKAEALDLLARLIEKFPDTEEANEAFRLQSVIAPPSASAAKASKPAKGDTVAIASSALASALRALPAPEAIALVKSHVESVADPTERIVPPPEVAKALAETIVRLTIECRRSLDALAITQDARVRLKTQPAGLRKVIAEALAAKNPALIASWEAAHEVLRPLAESAKYAPLVRDEATFAAAVESCRRAQSAYDADLLECRRLLAGIELEELHLAARERGPRLLVAGRRDELEDLYESLHERLESLAADKSMGPVMETSRRKQLPDFVRDRRALVAGLRAGLQAARAAEQAGDLDAAGQAYAALAKKHYTVRFDELIQVPLRVESSPAGAAVKVNGKDAGPAPVLLHYGWGVPTTVSVEAAGFEPLVRVLDSTTGVPVTHIEARLTPKVLWTISLEGNYEARPLAVGGDALVCDRAGRFSLHAGNDGHVIWSRHLNDVEGVRSQPAYDGERILVVFVNGRVVWLDPRDGIVMGEEQAARPLGDVAAGAGSAAVAVSTPAVLGFVRGRRAWETPLAAAPTTSVVFGHGAFWVGLPRATLVRLDPASGRATSHAIPDATATVVALTVAESGLLVCLSDGRLIALDASGARRFTAENLGDLGPAPAEAAGVVCVSDRRGRVTMLDAVTGAPRGSVSLGREPAGGLVSFGGQVIATTGDGRMWVLDPTVGRVRVDAPISGKGLLMPTPIGADDVVLVATDRRLLRVPVPHACPICPSHAPDGAAPAGQDPEPVPEAPGEPAPVPAPK
jgi:hypothetical protein